MGLRSKIEVLNPWYLFVQEPSTQIGPIIMRPGERRRVMKRLGIIALLLTCMSALVTTIAFAQELEQIKVTDLFNWARTTPLDWRRGTLFAGLGLVGALVTIFSLIGGAVPGTAGQAKIDADTERLDGLSRRLEELITTSPPDASAITAVENTVNNFRDDLRAERWRQFGIAAVFYALLGAFFSALLAQDILQALVIGAGWTGFIGTLGLKKDYAERKAAKDATLEKSLSRVKKLEEKLEEKGVKSIDIGLEAFNILERDVKIAKRL